MTDYFDSNAATNANGAAVAPATNGAATNGGDEMDAISVGFPLCVGLKHS